MYFTLGMRCPRIARADVETVVELASSRIPASQFPANAESSRLATFACYGAGASRPGPTTHWTPGGSPHFLRLSASAD